MVFTSGAREIASRSGSKKKVHTSHSMRFSDAESEASTMSSTSVDQSFKTLRRSSVETDATDSGALKRPIAKWLRNSERGFERYKV